MVFAKLAAEDPQGQIDQNGQHKADNDTCHNFEKECALHAQEASDIL